jgi:hypothetical protein
MGIANPVFQVRLTVGTPLVLDGDSIVQRAGSLESEVRMP